MVSFDVVSLFTNVPLDECIDLAVDTILESKLTKFSRENLKRLFTFCTSQTHFLFDGVYYDQIDGVCMGSPLGPVLANLFMSIREKEWIEGLENSGLLMYKRYVDDIFCCFENEENVTPFLEFLISQHANIKFTLEKEIDRVLNFLDVKVVRSSGTFATSTYTKPTNTGLLTNFTSFVPFQYKIGLIQTLFDRAVKICSSSSLADIDITNIISILQKNCFPRRLILKHLERVKQNRARVDGNVVAESKPAYFKLPFLGHTSKIMSSKIKGLIDKFCKDVDVRIIFETFKINSLFSTKDKTPENLRSHVVYKFSCAGCNATYIGETHRHLLTRVNEHLFTDENSSVFKHLNKNPACKQICDTSCFSLLDKARTKFQLGIKESIYVNRLNPTLNKQIKTYKMGLLLA